MTNRGVTLVEVLVVVAIVSILVIAFGFSFQGWQGTYNVESQVKDIFTDLLNARQWAMQKNRVHFFTMLNATSYTMHEDDCCDPVTGNKSPDGDGTLQINATMPDDDAEDMDDRLPSFPKTTKFDMRWNGAVVEAQTDISFNTRGLPNRRGNIAFFVDRDGNGKKDFCPDYDCVTIFDTRIKMGALCRSSDGDCCNNFNIGTDLYECVEK